MMKIKNEQELIWTGWTRRQFTALCKVLEKERESLQNCTNYNCENGDDPAEYAEEMKQVDELLAAAYGEINETEDA